MKWNRWIGIAVVPAAFAGIVGGGCAKNVNFETDEGGASMGGHAGMGGETAGGTGGQGGGALPCGIDCTTIATAACTQAVCNTSSGQCEIVPVEDGEPCDDGVFCTINDHCQGGLCVGPDPNDCGMDPGPCDALSCDETTETCTVTPLPDGTACTSPDLCVTNATCSFGSCQGTVKDCFFTPVPNECHVAQCNPMNGMCEPVVGNEGQPCIDLNDLCSDGNTCAAGVCQGGYPKDCSVLSVGCNNGVCDPATGQCVAQPVLPGQPCAEATDDCNAGNCDSMGNCIGTPINNGMMCDDGLTCTTGTTCNNGVCAGGTSTVTIYFSEDFSSNSAGWTLDPDWQIGPAAASSGHSYGNADPAQDHTPTADNGVGGVVIGGNATDVVHGFYYLTSPPVDTSNATTVFLEFWRWLNSDYIPYMQNVVEVYDGTTWVQLWASQGSPGVQDTAWTKISHDISAYKNTGMRVRFGFKIDSTAAFTVSQWNVDDVVIASAACN